MSYRDNSEALLTRNVELTAECERLKAECEKLKTLVADLKDTRASDNSEAVFKRIIDGLREENANMLRHLNRLDPGKTMAQRDAAVRTDQAASAAKKISRFLSDDE